MTPASSRFTLPGETFRAVLQAIGALAMVVGRTAVLAFLALTAADPASAMLQGVRYVVVKDTTRTASGFYLIPWHVGAELEGSQLEVKARRFRLWPLDSRLAVRTSWVLVPRCEESPAAGGRQNLTRETPNPLLIPCP